MHALSTRGLRRAGLTLALIAGVVVAGTSYTDFLHALAQRESSLRADAVNAATRYVGLYQLGEMSLQDVGLYGGDPNPGNDYSGGWSGKYGVRSLDDFLDDPDAQTRAVTDYHNLVWNRYLTNDGQGGAADYVGQTVGGITVTQSGLIAAAHLVGHAVVTQWLASGGTTDPQDQNATRMTEYLQRFAGYSLDAAAPAFALVLAATPSGGNTVVSNPGSDFSYAYTAPPLTADAAAPNLNAPAPAYGSAQQGFLAATGYQMGEFHGYFTALVAAGLFLWLGAVTVKTFGGYTAGNVAAGDMGQTILRALLIVLILVVILH